MNTTPSELPDAPGGSLPHVLVDDIADPAVEEEDRHHLARVLRLRSGDPLSVADGRGSWRWCVFDGDAIEPLSEVCFVEEPTPRLTVGFALIKGSKPEFVVQKLTELGLDSIVPFVAERSVVRWDESKIERMNLRLQRIGREACMQSRRVWLPEIGPVRRFVELTGVGGVARADRGGQPLTAAHTFVLIGPEGGWSEAEDIDGPVVGLGPNVLRAETAAVAAAALMVALRHGIVS